MFSSRKNRDNESLLSRRERERERESGGDKLWFVNPLIHSCRTKRGRMEKNGNRQNRRRAVSSVTLCADLSRQHKIFHFHPEKLRRARKRERVLHPACGSFSFFSPSRRVVGKWGGEAIKMANNIIQICRLDWFYDFSSRRFANVDVHSQPPGCVSHSPLFIPII